MRIGVARLLIDAPDLLLLDEPTNNLDGEGRVAIAALIAGWRGGVLVASHDRALLEGMDRIVELRRRSARGYSAVAGPGTGRARCAGRGRRAELERADQASRAADRAVQRQREEGAARQADAPSPPGVPNRRYCSARRPNGRRIVQGAIKRLADRLRDEARRAARPRPACRWRSSRR